jgi:hypothetical protein
MIEVNLNLLQSDELLFDTLEAVADKMSVRGSYNPMQFVLRLTSDIHRLLKNSPPGIKTPATASAEQFQAFSTLLHETIHWWQHVGSNFGFILGLTPISTAIARYVMELHTRRKNFISTSFKLLPEIDGSLPSSFRIACLKRDPV